MSTAPAVVADTSVWIAHFRSADLTLARLLRAGRIRMHPYVVSELALGSLVNRLQTLADLRSLPSVPVADPSELDRLIESRSLYSRGIGFVDAHLLASALLDGNLEIWTLDKRLAALAAELGVNAKSVFAG